MTWPWINVVEPQLGLDLAPYSNLKRWFNAIGERPAVQRGLKVPVLPEHT